MGVDVIESSAGVVEVRVSGVLRHADFAESQRSIAEIIERRDPVRLLIRAERFLGWAHDGDWGDVSFQERYDPRIDRIAIVGPERWEDLALLFTGRGLRPVAIEYFRPEQLDEARRWIAGAS